MRIYIAIIRLDWPSLRQTMVIELDLKDINIYILLNIQIINCVYIANTVVSYIQNLDEVVDRQNFMNFLGCIN